MLALLKEAYAFVAVHYRAWTASTMHKFDDTWAEQQLSGKPRQRSLCAAQRQQCLDWLERIRRGQSYDRRISRPLGRECHRRFARNRHPIHHRGQDWLERFRAAHARQRSLCSACCRQHFHQADHLRVGTKLPRHGFVERHEHLHRIQHLLQSNFFCLRTNFSRHRFSLREQHLYRQ